MVLFSVDTQRASDDGRETDLLLRRLSGDEEPPDGDEDTHAGPDAERRARARGVDDRAPDEAAEEERDDRDQLVVARDDALAEVEQLRVRHELAPDRREHDCGERGGVRIGLCMGETGEEGREEDMQACERINVEGCARREGSQPRNRK